MEQTASERQFDMLSLYGDLVSAREDWSGELVLACGRYADLAPTAVSIANGTTLWLTEDSAEAKAVMRRGEVDFVVNTLDEALRTLKNQVRQGKPLGVALVGDVVPIVAEIAERGLVPRRMLKGAIGLEKDIEMRPSVEALQKSGMWYRLLMMAREPDRWNPSILILNRNRYYAFHIAAQSLLELREIDAHLLARLGDEEIARRRWLQRVSRYLRDTPDGGRWVWLTHKEYEALPESWNVSPESL